MPVDEHGGAGLQYGRKRRGVPIDESMVGHQGVRPQHRGGQGRHERTDLSRLDAHHLGPRGRLVGMRLKKRHHLPGIARGHLEGAPEQANRIRRDDATRVGRWGDPDPVGADGWGEGIVPRRPDRLQSEGFRLGGGRAAGHHAHQGHCGECRGHGADDASGRAGPAVAGSLSGAAGPPEHVGRPGTRAIRPIEHPLR
jgi:hypothetical protein